jgi:hypothetical protein
MKIIAYNISDLHCEIYDSSLHKEEEGWGFLKIDYELPQKPWTLKNGKIETWTPIINREEMVLTRAEFRARLIKKGIMPETVETKLLNIADPIERALSINDWQHRDEVRRTSSLLISMAPQFGFSSDDLDKLFA